MHVFSETYCSCEAAQAEDCCGPPAPETCTPAEACDHGACIDGTCRLSLSTTVEVCAPVGGSPNCDPGFVCDAQPEGDPECVWPCFGYLDEDGHVVETPTLCQPGQICIEGLYCISTMAPVPAPTPGVTV